MEVAETLTDVWLHSNVPNLPPPPAGRHRQASSTSPPPAPWCWQCRHAGQLSQRRMCALHTPPLGTVPLRRQCFAPLAAMGDGNRSHFSAPRPSPGAGRTDRVAGPAALGQAGAGAATPRPLRRGWGGSAAMQPDTPNRLHNVPHGPCSTSCPTPRTAASGHACCPCSDPELNPCALPFLWPPTSLPLLSQPRAAASW